MGLPCNLAWGRVLVGPFGFGVLFWCFGAKIFMTKAFGGKFRGPNFENVFVANSFFFLGFACSMLGKKFQHYASKLWYK